MNWNALCIAGLLLLTPVALAQDDSTGSDGSSSTASKERYGLAGSFEEEFNDTHDRSFRAVVAEFGGRVTPYHKVDGEVLFGVDELTSLAKCEDLEDALKDQDYVSRVEDCRLTRNADGSTPQTGEEKEAEQEPPEQTEQDVEEQQRAEEEAAKDHADSEEEAQKQAEDDAEHRADREQAAAECTQKTGEAKQECFDDYCEDPLDKHADQCRKWRENREFQEERQESQTQFRTCKDGSTTAAERQECAKEYSSDVQDDDRWDRESKISEAKENGKVGARAFVRANGLAANDASNVEEYDVMLDIVTHGAKARDDDVDFRVTVSAELLEGRTIVLDVDPTLLSGPTLVIRYFDIFDDGTETEVVIRQATDLSDVLDPTDDAGQPEYWVVKDVNGLQLMASIPHWSVHAITVQGIGEFVSTPGVVVGIAAGIIGSVMAASVMFWPRRNDD